MPHKIPLILSFDTSAAHCAAALVLGDKVLATTSEPMSKGQAERLMPMLEETLVCAGKSWSDLDAIAVCVGPGNFTGVRISVSAARGLALALGIPAIGVSVFEGLAYGTEGDVTVILDGKRNQIFCQTFSNGAASSQPKCQQADLMDLDASDRADFIGFMASIFAEKHGSNCLSSATTPQPQNLAFCALKKFDDLHEPPAPLYLRAADAALPADPPPKILA